MNVQNSNFLESVVQWWCENQNLKSSDRFPQKKNWEFLWWYVSCESSTCLGMEQLKQRDKPNVPFDAIFLRALHGDGNEREKTIFFIFQKLRGPRGVIFHFSQFPPLFWTRGIRKNCSFHWGVPPLRLRQVRENATASQPCVRVWISKDNEKWECPHPARESLPLTSFVQCCGM